LSVCSSQNARNQVSCPEENKVTGDWGKLYEQLHALYSMQNITRMIIPRRMRWVFTMGGGGEKSKWGFGKET